MPRYPYRQSVAPTGAMGGPVVPTGVAPTAGVPYPTGVPTNVAPVRRIVHPTRYNERHTVTRYPIENVYPSHTHNVHHNVCEYYCCYPHTESHQTCKHVVDNCRPRRYC
jgi:hypothetical protein